ncbi:ABC transporter permease [Phaeocystidibacter luteus]|uniref:ABC transporter permease n=1 Tax=Phaeocystidibacter luteus TaxID=911197 RepID=A0A6N6RKT0_9FLAO|nr:FtsX-like permease family protein [Phaeocystidibacter luteus]KAB2813849.1 ABC transporter permease [Phaeocystidibacter luteus]
MKTLQIIVTIAWRNLWRNKVRSGVVVLAMTMGIWACIFLAGFSVGMNDQRTDSALSTYVGFAQVHANGWEDERSVELLIPNLEEVIAKSQEIPGYVAHASRLVETGMAASSYGALGVQVQGVDPAMDTLVYDLQTRLIEGEFLPESRRVPRAYVGESLAEELKLEVGSKFQVTLQDVSGYATQALFRVGGIFKTVSSQYDKSTILIRREDMAGLIGVDPSAAHEIVYKISSKEQAIVWAGELSSAFPNAEVMSWKEVSPELGYADDMMATSLYIFIGIIIMAISFGILNTMLMAILERRRELGMLMAVGMNKRRTFFMVMIETIFLGAVGAPIGILVGHLSLIWSGVNGFDLSSVGEGLNAYGMDAIVYPSAVPEYYLGIAVIVVVMTLLFSLYPAYKSIRLNPVQAIRSV